MGQIRLFATFRDRLPANVEKRIHMTGMEGIPWPSRSFWSDDHLVIHRTVGDSGYVSLPYMLAGGTEVLLTTSTMREQADDYLLELELARGLLNRLRNQAAAWGVSLSEAASAWEEHWRTACDRFIDAATLHYADRPAAAGHAVKAIEAAYKAQQLVVANFAENSLRDRRQTTDRLNTMFACQVQGDSHMTHAEPFVATFNAACVDMRWRESEATESKFDFSQVEANLNWCLANKLRVCLGPLLRFDKKSLPDWLYLWADDFDAIRTFVGKYVSEAVGRFQGKTHVWEVAGNANLEGALDLNEDQQLQLVVAAIEALRARDAQTPMVIGFSQPWAEYVATDNWEISPLHVADALVRAEVGVAGFSLELQLGYSDKGAPTRHLLDINEMIDRWSQLGTPLLIRLAIPSNRGEGIADGFQASPQRQADAMEAMVDLLLCKPLVHGIVYQQWCDEPTSDYPHGGLIDSNGVAKQALAKLTEVRRTVLH